VTAVPEPTEPRTVASVVLRHRWSGAPRRLHGKTLQVHYWLRGDGAVTLQLVAILDVMGEPVGSPRRTFPDMDWSEQQERGGAEGTGRRVVLKGNLDEARLLSWLESVGLKPEGDA
jgi:hypothetical protein